MLTPLAALGTSLKNKRNNNKKKNRPKTRFRQTGAQIQKHILLYDKIKIFYLLSTYQFKIQTTFKLKQLR